MVAFFAHDRTAEAQKQRAMMRRLEREFQREIETALETLSGELLDSYEQSRIVPDLTAIQEQAVRDAYSRIGGVTIAAFGVRIIDQGKSMGLVETKAGFVEFFRRLRDEWITNELTRERIVSVSRTTRKLIVSAISRGDAAGQSVQNIASNIRLTSPEINRGRAALIARTETHGAANFGMNETVKQTGLKLQKEWVATLDHRTRSFGDDDAFDHIKMDGQVREMDQPFEMPWAGGDPIRIMYPGEAGHPGGATINCRCAVVHNVIR